ncbi:MAG TPA: tetratricopeptide repeat protein [Terriglobales bacterium]|nr:tetratricopeptide repeat protein [Terriglobales bacterium]
MALGFGFNKTKVMAAAQKYQQQGKLQNAIAEYEKIAKEDPKDLTILNTIGDLYYQVGQTDKACVYFKRVGDNYALEGFTVKAIALYKKLTKLNPSASEAILKLAELYTQQGLYNDARAQYVQVADRFMQSGESEQAAKIFQKILELDPENAAMRARLADLYIKLGKKNEARDIYITASQSLYARGALDAADEALGKVLKLDPGNADALMLRGQIAVDSGDGNAAVTHLEQIPNLDSRPDALRALLRAYLLVGNAAAAEPIAGKLLTVHNDASGVSSFAENLLAAGRFEDALKIYDQHADTFLASNAQALLDALHASISQIKENAPALAILRNLYLKAGITTHLADVSELLAHAWVQAGELTKARDLYKELAELEPENELHMQSYKQVVAKLGEDSAMRPLTPEEGAQAFMVDELEHAAPAVEQSYSPEVAEAVRAALTDSELYASYNVPAKAIAPLEAALPQAPKDVQLNQQLASLYARAGRMEEAARCCDVLASVFGEAGHEAQARQYTDMGAKYRSRAAEAPAAAAEFAVEAAPPPATPAAGPAEFAMEVPAPEPAMAAHEVDLSSEWESMTSVEGAPEAPAAPPPPAAPSVADLVEEIRFYVSQAMWTEAEAAIQRGESLAPGNADLAALREQVAAATAPAAAEMEVAPAEAQPSVAEYVFDAAAVEPPVEAPPPPPPPPPPKPAAPPPKAAPPKPAPPPKPAAPPPPPRPAATAGDVLGDMVLDIEQSLGDDFGVAAPPPPPAAPPPAAKAAPPPAAPAPSAAAEEAAPAETASVLSDLFEEFKGEVEETSQEAEDPDTHYNLGVAFKEMGLLDEAIGELQKVCQAIDQGQPFSQAMQAYIWLAHCFMEKGVPMAAARWYEKALKVPNLQQENRLALYYELASAQEAAGDKQAALRNFMEVYGTNIDYRDVADRIKALKG